MVQVLEVCMDKKKNLTAASHLLPVGMCVCASTFLCSCNDPHVVSNCCLPSEAGVSWTRALCIIWAEQCVFVACSVLVYRFHLGAVTSKPKSQMERLKENEP